MLKKRNIKNIKELYLWAKENNILNIPIAIQYMDSGGYYDGNSYENNGDIEVELEQTDKKEYYILLSEY